MIEEIGEAQVGKVWWKDDRIFVSNSRIKNDFLKFTEKQSQASCAGKLGAQKRHKLLEINEGTEAFATIKDNENCIEGHTVSGNGRLTIPESRIQKPNNNIHTESLDASIPTIEEVYELAKMRGIKKEVAESFYEWHEINHKWCNDSGRLINWQLKLKRWENNSRKYESNSKAKAGYEQIPFGKKRNEQK